MIIDFDKEEQAAKLKGSYVEFAKFFFLYITGREFIISRPISRESHHITIARTFTEILRNPKPSQGVMINVPPGYSKSVMCCLFVAWAFAHYPDCNFLYISYSHSLASMHTAFIKQIMTSPLYKYLFDVEISHESRAKDKFKTTANGAVSAFGSGGSITGSNAGLPGLDRFSGAVLIDDIHKPDDIYSESIRETVIRNYHETIQQRPRDVKVPIIFIAQRLHEDDLGARLLAGEDTRKWETVILKGLDAAGNALYPEVQPKEYLLELKEKQPFVFYSQIQQEPVPAAGSLFKPEWFVQLDREPEIIKTFITIDTAETDKSFNDASVFSFWGIYEIEIDGKKINQLGLHWLDCWELRVEPKDLKDNFLDFYGSCCMHPKSPLVVAIEKKSTGTFLISILKELRGMTIREIERNRSSGSKIQRFLDIQPIVASKLVSFTKNAKHVDMCINHMAKINAAGSHRFDDIGDTLVDSVKLSLLEKTLYSVNNLEQNRSSIAKKMSQSFNRKLRVGEVRYGTR